MRYSIEIVMPVTINAWQDRRRWCASVFLFLLAAANGLGMAAAVEGQAKLRVQPRYHRWHVDPGQDWVETNTDYARLDWSIPLGQTALVLVDVWDRHYLKDTEARSEKVIAEKLVPLLKACRAARMPIIHAPSPRHAQEHPNWVGASGESSSASSRQADIWPPAEFRSKSGPFQQFARPAEPRAAELAELRAALKIHPKAAPAADEPVVAAGEELHAYCKRAGILFLFYAGFNTNACVLTRDYGTVAMRRRGYEVIVVRDCTTGMESCRTHQSLSQTDGAILFLEMFGSYSVAAQEIIAGLQAP